MKTLISALLVGVLLFAGSAGVSWYLVILQEKTAEEVVSGEEPTDDHPSEFPTSIDETDKVDAMPVALRPEVPVTVEAVTELAQSIMKKEQSLNDSFTQLKKDEKRINLLFQDLKREREELEAFGQRVEARILEAREAVELLKLENQSLADQTKTLTSLENKTGKTSDDAENSELDSRVQSAKKMFSSMKAEQAAEYLKEYANRGELEFSARLLNSVDERQITKILEAFNDTPLVAQIIDAYHNSKIRSNDQSDAAPSEFRNIRR